MSKYPSLPNPDGWYAVCFSDELRPGSLMARKLFDRDVVVFRTESGRAAMLDAWGPIVSSVVFALMHVPPRRELWPWTVSAGLLGLLLAALTLATGNLGAAIVAHFVINSINLAYITRRAPAIVLRGPVRP